MWTHANILLTPLNFRLEGEENFEFCFDNEDDFQAKNNLWFLANSCWGYWIYLQEKLSKQKWQNFPMILY